MLLWRELSVRSGECDQYGQYRDYGSYKGMEKLVMLCLLVVSEVGIRYLVRQRGVSDPDMSMRCLVNPPLL